MPIKDDDILALVRQDMDKARDYQAELSAEREKLYKLYRAEPYGNERPGWSQSVHPTIFSVVEWMKPGLIEVFTGDFFAFSPTVPTSGPDERKDAQRSAERLKKYVRHKLFNQLQGEQLIEDFVHDCLVNHYGVMKVTQRDEFDLTTELLPEMAVSEIEALAARETDIVDIKGGRNVTRVNPLTGTEEACLRGAKAVRKKQKYKGFNLEVVPPRELYMLPGYADLGKNPFVAHVVKRDLDYIRRQELTGNYRKGSFDKVRAHLDGRRATAETEAEFDTFHSVDGLSTPGAPDDFSEKAALGKNEVSVWECYMRLALDETGLLKPCVVTVCEDVILRGPVENPYDGAPLELGYVYKEPHKSVGRPIAAMLDQRQRVLSNLLRNIQDSAAMSTYRGYMTTDARAKKILASMGPGDVSLVPSLGTVQEIVPTPADPMILEAFNLTMQEVSKESGVNENMQGLDNNALNQTAAGMQMRLSAGMQRQKLYARRIARSFKRILGRVLDIIRLYPPEDDMRVVGTDVSIEQGDVMGQYTVSIDVGVGPQERMESARIMDELIQMMLRAGLQLGICEPRAIIKAITAKYEFLDVDVSEYFMSDERMDQVKELKQQLEELQGHNQGLQKAIAEHATELRKEQSGRGGGFGPDMPPMGAGGPGAIPPFGPDGPGGSMPPMGADGPMPPMSPGGPMSGMNLEGSMPSMGPGGGADFPPMNPGGPAPSGIPGSAPGAAMGAGPAPAMMGAGVHPGGPQ